jgi:hypothetical protein
MRRSTVLTYDALRKLRKVHKQAIEGKNEGNSTCDSDYGYAPSSRNTNT